MEEPTLPVIINTAIVNEEHSEDKDKPLPGKINAVKLPTTQTTPKSSVHSKNTHSSYSKKINSSMIKKEVPKTTTNSNIPLRTKSTTATKPKPSATTSYSSNVKTPLNKVSLEKQFTNNKKKLMDMYHDLSERQRPIIELHKTLMRTKKQLEEVGKIVPLEELKLVSMKVGEKSSEAPVEEISEVKNTIEVMMDNLIRIARKFLSKRAEIIKSLDQLAKSENFETDIRTAAELYQKENTEYQQQLQSIISENVDKLEELNSCFSRLSKGAIAAATNKVQELEHNLADRKKAMEELEEKLTAANRKMEDKKNSYEKMINEFQDKLSKLEEELKFQKKSAVEANSKMRTFKNKLAENDGKYKESEDKAFEATQKLKQLQEVMQKKEIQWMKEKEEFKKNEAALRQKFIDKQKKIDARTTEQANIIQELEEHLNKTSLAMEQKLLTAEEELAQLEKKNMELEIYNTTLKKEIEVLHEKIRTKGENFSDKNISQLKSEYDAKLKLAEDTIVEQKEHIVKIQEAGKKYAQVAVALKLEKERAVKCAEVFHRILKEAKEDINRKNDIINKVHDQLQKKEYDYEKIKNELKNVESRLSQFSGDHLRSKPLRCEFCMTPIFENEFQGVPEDFQLQK